MKLLITCKPTFIRETLRRLVEQLESNTTVLEAIDYREGLEVLKEHDDLSLVLVSMMFLDTDGAATVETFYEARPRLPIVVVSDSQDQNDIQKVISGGAKGFVPMSFTPDQVLEALKKVLNGEMYIPNALTGLSADSAALVSSSGRAPVSSHQTGTRDMFGLTPRHREILALLKLGKSNKEIAYTLNLVEGTVKIHCMAIFRELGVTNRTQAAIKAKQIFTSDSDKEESRFQQTDLRAF